jgi:hypothetical protein
MPYMVLALPLALRQMPKCRPKPTQARTSPPIPCPPRSGVHRRSPIVPWPLIAPRPRKPPHSPRVYDMRCCSFQTHVMVQSQNCGETKPATQMLMGGCGGRFQSSAGDPPPPPFFRGVENLTVQRYQYTTRMGICNTPHFWLANQLAIVFLGSL